MRATLHNHSIYSDGSKTIKEINEIAIKNGFDVVAITDHDTIDSYLDILDLDTSVRFIIGVELSTIYKNENVHVLGYFSGLNENVIKFFKNMRRERVERCKKIIDNLREFDGIDISFDEVRKLAHGVVGRPHVAKILSAKLGISVDQAFKKYIGNYSKSYVPVGKIGTEDAVKFLKENDAIVSLAHPIKIKGFDYKELLKFGFDAIEVYHPSQNEECSNNLRKVAKDYNLIITGGSDYHGINHINRFEQSYIEGEDLDIFLDKIDGKTSKNKLFR